MDDLFSSDDDLFDMDEVVGKVDSSSITEFKPWHKPRKQFIREVQWFQQLERIAKARKYSPIDTISYFGLPGGDLLDVTYISQKLLEHNDLKVKQLLIHGFINSGSEYKKAESGMSKLLDCANVSKNSKVERFSFEDLSKENSEAWKRVKNMGHYNIVNLDFCDCALNEDTLPSLYRLLDYQIKRIHDKPWLLCITTRLNSDGITETVLEKFESIFQEFKKNPDLTKEIEKSFNESLLTIESLNNLDEEQESTFNELLQICLIFWLINEAIKNNCVIELKSSYKYSVDAHNPALDMHSFVFKLENEDSVAPDILGLVEGSDGQGITADKIKQIHMSSISKLGNSLDLDSHLSSNKDLLNQFADKMMELLSSCGYKTEHYKQVMSDRFGYSF